MSSSKSPSLRRIQADIRELQMSPSPHYFASPLENDMFVWHFTIRGAPGTDFQDGIYHGTILLPAEYPFKPPNIMFSTPNGRFETHTKLCLSFSAYHPELWQPAWGIRLILEALISFLPTKGDGAIGALDWTSQERQRLAKKSVEYSCPTCGNCKLIMDRWSERAKKWNSKHNHGNGSCENGNGGLIFQKQIEQLHALQAATEGVNVGIGVNVDDNAKHNLNEQQEEEEQNKQHEQHTQVDDNDNIHLIANDKNKDNNYKNDMNETRENYQELQKSDMILNVTTTGPAAPAAPDHVVDTEENNKNENNRDYKETTHDDDSLKVPCTSGISSNNNNITYNINNSTAEVVQPQSQQPTANNNNVPESPLLSDTIVHSCIVIFSAIVFLLVRKLNDILVDMKELEERYQQST